MSSSDKDKLADLPKGGPLEPYRNKASFNWKDLKIFYDDCDLIVYRYNIWETLRNDPLFSKQINDSTIKEQKEIAGKRSKRLSEYAFCTRADLRQNPMRKLEWNEAIMMWNVEMMMKYDLHYEMFQDLIRSMGTERHKKFVEKCKNYEYSGCFCMTEISHGSNTKGLKTAATYDPKTEEFIINTPTIEDSKIWSGNLGKAATHAAVYAQLYTPDRICHGLHVFIVPIRDPFTMNSLPGVIVGEMGAKAGLDGVDNGFVTFNNVRIPRENLLNKTGDITPDGRYVTPYKNASKRHGVSLGILSNGRIAITFLAHCLMIQALTIAIRYAAVRKQFGPAPGEEIPIIEYQLHQYRLLPGLALCLTWRHFAKSFFANQIEFLISLKTNKNREKQAEFSKEIHAISCASKPVSSWTAQQIIQECREACGGHGYLKSSRLAELRNNNDPLMTFEGDNNVLLQQTSNYIIAGYEEFLKTESVPQTPFGSLSYLASFQQLNTKLEINNKEELLKIEILMKMFDWLLCYLTKISSEKLNSLLKDEKDLFIARNDSQVFTMKTLAIAYVERLLIMRFIQRVQENNNDSLKLVLNRILFLAAYYTLDKHLVYFYQGGFFFNDKPAFIIRELILDLCAEMKNEAVSLVDAFAPPDYVLNSTLGSADGSVYKTLYSTMVQTPGAFERLSWYEDFMDKKDFGSRRAKL